MRAGEEKAVQRYALKLDALRASAKSEFELRGPFPDDACFMLEYPLTDAIPSVEGTKDRLLGKIYQFRREHQPSLAAVKEDDQEDDAGVNNNDSTNGNGNRNGNGKAKLKPPKLELHVTAEEKDYALLYAYTLVTAQVAHELQCVQKEMEGLFGVLNDESLLLR
ncbi:hypothetical protein HYQ44_004251 [Verticillium longisporum]|nr:hypothetical protein HYQ44_004251 [Verticillium longisporum]